MFYAARIYTHSSEEVFEKLDLFLDFRRKFVFWNILRGVSKR